MQFYVLQKLDCRSCCACTCTTLYAHTVHTYVISHVACCVHVYIADVVLFATRTGVPQGKHTLLLLYAIMHLHILMCVHVCPLPCTSLFANFVLQTNRVLQFVTSIRINVCQAFAQKICI